MLPRCAQDPELSRLSTRLSLTTSSAHPASLDVQSELLRMPAQSSVSSLTHSIRPLLRARSTAWPMLTESLPLIRSLSNSPSLLPSRRRSLTSSRRRSETEQSHDFNGRNRYPKNEILQPESSHFGELVLQKVNFKNSVITALFSV